MLEIQVVVVLRHVFAAHNSVDFHAFVVIKPVQQLRRDQEILARMLFTGDINHTLMNDSLIPWVHALVDLINHTKG